jgi:hypothetical protein
MFKTNFKSWLKIDEDGGAGGGGAAAGGAGGEGAGDSSGGSQPSGEMGNGTKSNDVAKYAHRCCGGLYGYWPRRKRKKRSKKSS